MAGPPLNRDLIDVSQLSQSGRLMLAKIAKLLMARYSGEITLRCKDGGVQVLRTMQEFRPNELEDDT